MSFSKQKGSDKRTGICRLEANSDLTIYSAAANHASITEYFSEFKTFYIDLSKTEEIDSTGVQILLSLNTSAKQQDKDVFFHSPSTAVNDVFNLLSITDQFTWNDSEQAS